MLGEFTSLDLSLKNAGNFPQRSLECHARAKYYVTPEGEMKLARVQYLSVPSFHAPGWEIHQRFKKLDASFRSSYVPEDLDDADAAANLDDPETDKDWNLRRSLNRAKNRAFDYILCNSDLDCFVTFTFDPQRVGDYTSWDDVYSKFRIWLSNMVQRYGLKYVCCPERYRTSEGLHMHAICNSAALGELPRARSAHTGRAMCNKDGLPIYNVPRFTLGFTTAVMIQSTTLDRERVSKYIFKYMGKQGLNGRIGGRFVLCGGDLQKPIFVYDDDVRSLLPDKYLEGATVYHRKTEFVGMEYEDWSFI